MRTITRQRERWEKSYGDYLLCTQGIQLELELETFLDSDEDEDNNAQHIYCSRKKDSLDPTQPLHSTVFSMPYRLSVFVSSSWINVTNDYDVYSNPDKDDHTTNNNIILIVRETVVEFIMYYFTSMYCS